jgi:hypothetical protein
MAGIQIVGNGGVVADVNTAATGFRAQRISGYPNDIGARGAYGIGLFTGILPAALAANSEIFQWRWAHATLLCLPRSIRIGASVTTTMFAAGVPIQIEARLARGWTVQGTGGTGITFGTDDSKKRTQFAQSAMATGDVRQATTAALGAGTKTLDGTPFANIVVGGPITASLNGTIMPAGTRLWTRDTSDEYPLLFEQNEGFAIRVVAVPATGTWRVAIDVEWSEIDPATQTEWA